MRIGILGGGQLGRMLCLSGYPLGFEFTCYDPSKDAPAGHVSPLAIGDYTDTEYLQAFAKTCDVITYEFENVPISALDAIQGIAPIYPGRGILEIAQDRVKEKTFFRKLGIPTPEFFPCSTQAQLETAVQKLGYPCVLKTTRMGYDGKGQLVINSSLDLMQAKKMLASPLILEQFMPFTRELSLIAVRSKRGEMVFYPLVENVHREGILRTSQAPAKNSARLQKEAEAYTSKILKKSGYVGVLTIEFFDVKGKLYANEMAPRVHNSGHWTIEGAKTSQFENHIRAITGLPLGSTKVQSAVFMANLIGNHPPIEKLAKIEGLHIHLYGKEPRPKRKIGHLTAIAKKPAFFSSL